MGRKPREVKKRLNVRKKELILLAVYKVYGAEFDDSDIATEFVQKMIEWEENEEDY